LSRFKSGFAADKAQFRALGSDLGTAITTANHKTNGQIASEFGALAARATQSGVQLRKLNAPPQYKGQVSKLASAFDSVAADLTAISRDATVGNATGAQQATVTLLRHATVLKSLDVKLSSELGLPTK
jgi:hypothetical protein